MMAVQGFYFLKFKVLTTSNLVANNTRLLLNYRLPQLSQLLGIKQKAADTLKDLKIPEKPKRPLTAYFRFTQERRAPLTQQNPNWKITQIALQCAAEWKKVDPAVKAKYESEYKAEMEQYAKKYLEYTQNLTDEQKEALEARKDEVKQAKLKRERKKKLRDCAKPKRPMGAYMHYIIQEAKAQPKKTHIELMTELKGNWANMPASEKAPFTQMAEKAKQRYMEEMEQWENRMIKEGNLDLVRQSTLAAKKPKPAKRE